MTSPKPSAEAMDLASDLYALHRETGKLMEMAVMHGRLHPCSAHTLMNQTALVYAKIVNLHEAHEKKIRGIELGD